MTTTLISPQVARTQTRRLPNPWLAQIGYEVRGYFRQLDTVFFTFLFPLMFLVLFSVIFTEDAIVGEDSVNMATYFLPAMLAAGLLLSGIQNLAIDIAQEKHNGKLKRLGGTPMSPATYFVGKIGQVFVTGACQAALTILVAVVFLGAEIPTEPRLWLRFAWLVTLGLATMSLLGIALSAVPRSGKSASPVVIPIMLFAEFTSGVFIDPTALPESMTRVANFFPLAPLVRGMRSVFLPDSFKVLELNDDWDLGRTAIVLAGWLVVGLILSRATFRWNRSNS